MGHPAFIHSDLIRSLGLFGDRIQDKSEAGFVKAALDYLNQEFGPDLIFPAFNFDFPTRGVFDMENDPVQVGMIPEMLRGHKDFCRSWIPFFSTLSQGPSPIDYSPHCFPLGQDSIFQWLTKNDATLVFMGCSLEAMTYIHYAESLIPGGPVYRYDKKFTGNILGDEKSRPISCTMHVRPMGLDIAYDFDQLKGDLRSQNILLPHDPQGIMETASCTQILAHFLEHYEKDPLYGLTPDSKRKLETHTRKGRLRLQDFE